MGDNYSLEPFINDHVSDHSPSTVGKSDLRVKNINNPIDGYQPSDSEINQGTDITNYYGFLNAEGAWYIMKEVTLGVSYTYTYAKDDSGYDWSDRANATYAAFNITF